MARTTYTNPRLEATFQDWPLGGNRRGPCRFFTEYHPKRGYRVGRITTGKPKFTTYHPASAIVDGDDGRTYILAHAQACHFVTVYRSDFFQHETVHQSDEPDRYADLVEMILRAEPMAA